jgi:uncharacterized membrane protein YkvA (DUF1232 family)
VKELLLALPRLARMLVSLAADRDVPTAAKVVLAALAVYLASPLDVIPDFIPWLGFLDDVILAAVVVDGVISFIDRALLLRYWPGTPASLERVAAVARRLARWVPKRIKARLFGAHQVPLPAARPEPDRSVTTFAEAVRRPGSVPLPQERGRGERGVW